MRTTLQLDDDVLAAARVLADERAVSLGAAVSELARRGLRGAGLRRERGLPVLDVGPDSPIVTPEMVRDALDEP
jgi:hypothetical protein